MDTKSRRFWIVVTVVLLAMNLVQVVALHSAVVKLEGYYDENNRLKNRISFLEHQTNRYAK